MNKKNSENEEEQRPQSLDDVLALSGKVGQFKQLLEDMESVDSKKKALFLEIYENAITDRALAATLFTELHEIMGVDPVQHAAQGPQIAKYLERMSKSTDQLLKLAELVSADSSSSSFDYDAVFEKSKSVYSKKK